MPLFQVESSWPTEWMIVRTVTHVGTRPCQRKVRVRPFTGSPVEAWVDCGRRLPATQQCQSCRHHIVIQLHIQLPVALAGHERAAS